MQDLHEKAFFRHPGFGDYDAYKRRVSRVLNGRNIFFLPKRKIAACALIGNQEQFLSYRFELLLAWMKKSRRRDMVFVLLLRYLLKRLCLAGLLNAYEQNFLSSNENLVFAKDRSIKNLVVDFAKNSGEVVGFHYDNVTISQLCERQQRELIGNADIYFSNQRVFVSSTMHSFWVANREIVKAEVQDGRLWIQASTGLVFSIASETPRVLLIALTKMRR